MGYRKNDGSMNEKVEILLNKINIDKEHYQYFSDAKMSKIKINSHTNNWNIFITNLKIKNY